MNTDHQQYSAAMNNCVVLCTITILKFTHNLFFLPQMTISVKIKRVFQFLFNHNFPLGFSFLQPCCFLSFRQCWQVNGQLCHDTKQQWLITQCHLQCYTAVTATCVCMQIMMITTCRPHKSGKTNLRNPQFDLWSHSLIRDGRYFDTFEKLKLSIFLKLYTGHISKISIVSNFSKISYI